MRTVLGIDAAWTASQPSGVALVGAAGQGWRLLALAPSYAEFLARAGGRGQAERLPGLGPDPTALLDPNALLAACVEIGGGKPDLVAVDMPLSREPIAGRRPCDDAISAAYGSRKAGTHTPSAERPGAISDTLRAGFAACGYGLLTSQIACPGLAEVYPHPALIELTNAPERLPYKAAKTRIYWPSLGAMERHLALRRVWADILGVLESHIACVGSMLPTPGPATRGRALKAFEDMLDAVVCAWVGCCILDGRARAFGDGSSAIWVPTRPVTRLLSERSG